MRAVINAVLLGALLGYPIALTRFAPDCGPVSALDVGQQPQQRVPELPPPPENRTWRTRVVHHVDGSGDVREALANWTERY